MQNTQEKISEIKANHELGGIFKNSKLSFVFLTIFIIGIVGAIGVVSIMIGRNYSKRIGIDNQNVREIKSQRAEFAVGKIILKKNGQVYEISDNGLVISYFESTSNIINNRRVISNSRLSGLFKNLTEDEFLNLLAGYYTSGDSYTLTIETTAGTKTIVFNNQNPNPPPEEIEDVVDEVEDIIEELDDPQPTPPYIAPTPTPINTPTPQPSPLPSNTPIPSPGASPGIVVPFSCDMLQNQINDVTVSNTVCIPEN